MDLFTLMNAPRDPTVSSDVWGDDRKIVIAALHYNGEMRSLLKSPEYERAYCMCDGFGTISRKAARAQCFDWSHVRDSSDSALSDAAEYLRDILTPRVNVPS